MTKQQIIDHLNEENVQEPMMGLLKKRLSLYPEELLPIHEDDFEQYLEELQAEQLEAYEYYSKLRSQLNAQIKGATEELELETELFKMQTS